MRARIKYCVPLSPQQSAKLNQEVGNRQGEAAALGNIGLIYKARGELDKALENMLGALAIFMDIGMSREAGIVGGNLARLHQEMGHERFVAGCVKSGMSRERAEEMTRAIEKSKGK